MQKDSNEMTQNTYKITFLGGAGVGKSSIISNFMYGSFTRDYEVTVGIDFFTRAMEYEGEKVYLNIWDTAGQEQFGSLIPSYMRNSSMAVVVYDVNDRNSVDTAKRWHQSYVESKGANAPCILVGNKVDLLDDSDRENNDVLKAAENLSNELKISHALTSAKSGVGINDLFATIVAEISSQRNAEKTEQNTNNNTVTITDQNQTNRSGCC